MQELHEIEPIERAFGMSDNEFLQYLEMLERVLQLSISRRINSNTKWRKSEIVFKPAMTEQECSALGRIQFTILQFYQ